MATPQFKMVEGLVGEVYGTVRVEVNGRKVSRRFRLQPDVIYAGVEYAPLCPAMLRRLHVKETSAPATPEAPVSPPATESRQDAPPPPEAPLPFSEPEAAAEVAIPVQQDVAASTPEAEVSKPVADQAADASVVPEPEAVDADEAVEPEEPKGDDAQPRRRKLSRRQ